MSIVRLKLLNIDPFSRYVICAGYSHLSTQEVLTLQMERFREYLLANIVWTDRQEVFHLLLRGVDEGIMKVSID